MRSFAELCKMFDCDKHSRHRYDPLYERLLGPYRGLTTPVRILEIGIDKGASLRVWMNYLHRPVIYAIDIDPASCAAAPSGVTTYCGDQADPEFLRKVVGESGGHFNVVIDDGGHGMWQQHVSFDMLWPAVVAE